MQEDIIRLTIPGEAVGKQRARVYSIKLKDGRVTHKGLSSGSRKTRIETLLQ